MLARRVSAEGRTRAYVGGRSATAADLQEVGGALLSFYGQHEHRKLTLASAQLDILDGFCGPEQSARRDAFAAAYGRERALGRRSTSSGPAPGRATASSTCSSGSSQEIEAADAQRGGGDRARGRAGAAPPPRGVDRRRRRRASERCPATTAAARARPPRSRRAARALEAVRGIDAELDVLGDRVARARGRGGRPVGRPAPLRRGRRGGSGPARRGRGAPRAARPAEAQARRHARGGARARRALPPRGATS